MKLLEILQTSREIANWSIYHSISGRCADLKTHSSMVYLVNKCADIKLDDNDFAMVSNIVNQYVSSVNSKPINTDYLTKKLSTLDPKLNFQRPDLFMNKKTYKKWIKNMRRTQENIDDLFKTKNKL